MQQMVMRFMPDGSIQHTLKDTFFDPSKELGVTRKIDRMTDILFDEKEQKFYVKFLRGHWPDVKQGLCGATLAKITEGDEVYWFYLYIDIPSSGKTAFFDTYEEAVAQEIEFVNAARRSGAVFDE